MPGQNSKHYACLLDFSVKKGRRMREGYRRDAGNGHPGLPRSRLPAACLQFVDDRAAHLPHLDIGSALVAASSALVDLILRTASNNSARSTFESFARSRAQ